jgi:hypothetical protein
MNSSTSAYWSILNPQSSRTLTLWLSDSMNELTPGPVSPYIHLAAERGVTSLKRSVFRIRSNCLFMYALSRERVYTCYLGNYVFTAICCNGSMISEPLSSNGHLALFSIFRPSGVMSQYQLKRLLKLTRNHFFLIFIFQPFLPLSLIFSCLYLDICRSQWLRGQRHEMFLPVRTLWLWIESHSRHGCLCAFFLSLSCPVYVATLLQGWSPVQGILSNVYKIHSSRLIMTGNRSVFPDRKDGSRWGILDLLFLR